MWQTSDTSQSSPPSLLPRRICRVVAPSQKCLNNATSWYFTISRAQYMAQGSGRQGIFSRSLYRTMALGGSLAVSDFFFRDRGVCGFAHWVGGWLWRVMQVQVGLRGGQMWTEWSLCQRAGL